MKPVLATTVVLALVGGSASMQGIMVGVPGTVSVPLSVVVVLVAFTGLAVWAIMSARRSAAVLARLRAHNEELEAELAEARSQAAEAAMERKEILTEARAREQETDLLMERTRVMEKILAAGARFNATRNLSDLPARITTAVGELAGFDKAVLYLWSEVTEAFEARGFAGLSEKSVAGLTDLQVSRAEFESTCSTAYRYGNCYLVDRRAGEPSLSGSGGAPAGHWPADRLLIVPLTTPSGETLGYLTLDEPSDGRTPDEVDIRLLEFLVYQGAIAMESALVYDRLARNNAELSQASEKLGSLAEMKANFVANVSHELRTPLTSISAYAELLQVRMDSMSDQERNEFLKVIHNESVKLSEIIDDILEINEMDSGRPGLVQVQTDLVSLVRHLEDSWSSRARERDITLEVTTSADSILLPVDSTMINQMLGKLVSNAFKFNRDGGRVSITLEETGTAVRLVVEDTGIGIPDEELGRIFERFYQVDGSATREHNGQGLGLAICHDIVTHHDGRIWAENIQPRGARFTVLLPRRPAVHQATSPEPILRFSLEPGEFVQRIMHWIAESMGVRVVSLMTPLDDGEHLGIRAAIGLPESVVQSVRIRRGIGVAGRVWEAGSPLLIEDITLDSRFDRDQDEIRYGSPSLLCSPVTENGEVVGVVVVNDRFDGRPLGEDDRLLLEALSPRLGRMLAGCTRLRDQARDFEVIRDSLRTITPVGHLPRESILDICREICLAAGRRIHLAEEDLQHLAFTLRFYDVGMSCVPPQLLNKPGPLDEAEMVLVQRHVRFSLDILDPLLPEPKVRQLVLHHHENFDGSGYPDGLAGEAIPLGARLIRLTDTLAALLSPRPWRPAYGLDDALAEIRKGVGGEFCPRMAEVFFRETLARRRRIEALQGLPGDDLDLARPGLDQRGMVTVRG